MNRGTNCRSGRLLGPAAALAGGRPRQAGSRACEMLASVVTRCWLALGTGAQARRCASCETLTARSRLSARRSTADRTNEKSRAFRRRSCLLHGFPRYPSRCHLRHPALLSGLESPAFEWTEHEQAPPVMAAVESARPDKVIRKEESPTTERRDIFVCAQRPIAARTSEVAASISRMTTRREPGPHDGLHWRAPGWRDASHRPRSRAAQRTPRDAQ